MPFSGLHTTVCHTMLMDIITLRRKRNSTLRDTYKELAKNYAKTICSADVPCAIWRARIYSESSVSRKLKCLTPISEKRQTTEPLEDNFVETFKEQESFNSASYEERNL